MENYKIPFNKPFITGKEVAYLHQAAETGKISGNGLFTQKCQKFIEGKYGFAKCLLTTSCTDSLEMAAILCNIKVGDEVIVPSFTFVSTAIAFIRQGAKIIFADSYSNNPNIDSNTIESLITSKTKAIVPVHYAGVACNMDEIMELATKYKLYVIEDAAQAIDSYYISPKTGKKQILGSIGHFGCFSFHETKNIISGEGGMLTINDSNFIERSEIIWEKGTNRASFFRGEINKYGWVDVGSSFLPSEIMAAFLYAQFEHIEEIQKRRIEIWERYYDGLAPLYLKNNFHLPLIPSFSANNGHMFYLVCNSEEDRQNLINHLKLKGVLAVFHYQSLHNSPYYNDKYDGRALTSSDKFSNQLVRLPLFYELTDIQIDKVIDSIYSFYLK